MCKIYMTPRGIKKKAEEEENEKRKKKREGGGGEASQEVDQPCTPAVQQKMLMVEEPTGLLCEEIVKEGLISYQVYGDLLRKIWIRKLLYIAFCNQLGDVENKHRV